MAIADLLAPNVETDLIGQLNTYIWPDASTPWTMAIYLFSSTLGFLGTFFIAWMIISGIVSTATSGKVLGDKYHQIWAPLRVVFGIGMLIPMQDNGLSAGDKLNQLIFNMGRNWANSIAQVGLNMELTSGQLIMPTSLAGRTIATKIAIAEACLLAQNLDARTMRYNNLKSPRPAPKAEGTPVFSPEVKSWYPWGEDTPPKLIAWTWDYGIECGSISIDDIPVEDFGQFSVKRRQEIASIVSELRNSDFYKGIKQTFEDGGLTSNLLENKDIEKYLKSGVLKAGLLNAVNQMGDKYNGVIAGVASQEARTEHEDAIKEIKRGAETKGWFILAAANRLKGRAAEKAFGYASQQPTIVDPDPNAWGTAAPAIEAIINGIKNQLDYEANDAKLAAAMRSIDKEAGILATIVNPLTDSIREQLIGYKGFRPDPQGDMINMGHKLLVVAETGFVAGIAATGAASTTSALTQTPQKIVEFVMVPGWWILGMCFIAGGLLAFVLPVLSGIYLFFNVVIVATESIAFTIGSKLWAFMHLRMDGDEFVSAHQAAGYQLLFAICLRQPITVISYFGIRSISIFLHNLFLSMWGLVVISGQGNSSFGVAALVFSFVAMFVIQWHIELRTNGLMLEITPRVAQIIGSHAVGWNEQNHADSAIAAGSNMMAMQGNQMTNLARSSGGKGNAQPKKKGDDSKYSGVRNLKINDMNIEKK